MFDLQFQMHTRPDGTVVLAFGLSFRLLFAVLALMVGVGIAGSIGGDAPGIVPIVIFTVLMLGALYQERWIFDPGTRSIVSAHGLIGLAFRRRWSFDQVAALEYTSYRAGSVPGSVTASPANDVGLDDTRRAAAEATSRFSRVPRGMNRYFLRYSLVFSDGRRRRIELRRVRDWEREKQIPAAVAAAIGVPLEFTSL
ncbi:MAG: hypothetical protein PF508_15415 [Spirochaeta sp.]|jgi:hypothetical protein|nr:hypothetical protein [Spirochaeta sp.]